MSTRIEYALVTPLTDWPKVGHYVGSLPESARSLSDQRERLPQARVLLLERNEDGSVTLNRFDKDGSFAGDTWHPASEEAKDQAAYEYEQSLGEWHEVPEGTPDPLEYALKQTK